MTSMLTTKQHASVTVSHTSREYINQGNTLVKRSARTLFLFCNMRCKHTFSHTQHDWRWSDCSRKLLCLWLCDYAPIYPACLDTHQELAQQKKPVYGVMCGWGILKCTRAIYIYWQYQNILDNTFLKKRDLWTFFLIRLITIVQSTDCYLEKFRDQGPFFSTKVHLYFLLYSYLSLARKIRSEF